MGSSLVMVLQSAQEVVTTVIALIASVVALLTAGMSLRGTYKKWKRGAARKEKLP